MCGRVGGASGASALLANDQLENGEIKEIRASAAYCRIVPVQQL